jgi:hypothetical protein
VLRVNRSHQIKEYVPAVKYQKTLDAKTWRNNLAALLTNEGFCDIKENNSEKYP